MKPPLPQPYKFRSGEAGIFVEIYLPKKPSFQGTLYDTLVKGFQIKNVQKHFRSKSKLKRIRVMLEDMEEVRLLDDPANIKAFPPVMFGYSMYEVEGVFFNSAKQQPENELTQVLRIMFKPDLDTFRQKNKYRVNAIPDIKRITKNYLRSTRRTELEDDPQASKMQRQLVGYLKRWKDYVGLFLFGFIVYEMCEQITRLCDKGRMKWNDAEDEIWVTHFWSLNINSIRLIRKHVSRRQD